MKFKSIFYIIPSLIILVLLILIPYSLFSFDNSDSKKAKLLTQFNSDELDKVSNLLQQIDTEKITDENLKDSISNLKQTFSEEKERFEENKKLEQEQKKAEEESKQKEEQEKLEKQKSEESQKVEQDSRNDKKEESTETPKEQAVQEKKDYPLELDLTNKLAKLHIQERNLSCEAAATADILSTILKSDVKEKTILDKMKKEKTYGKPSYSSNGKLYWGDPDNGFVGEMDGHQYNLTGFAIYEKPMSEVYKEYGVKTALYNKFENNLGLKNPKEALTHMLKELNNGNFVQIRGDYCTDQKYEDGTMDRKITTEESKNGLAQKNFCYSFNQERRVTWHTDDGKEIYAPKQSHNFILLGYIGNIENPEKIIIWDTQTGRHIYPTAEWMRKWELNDARAIIVYDESEKN
ncbi:C39 family peptidase [Candidatus Gracilibacteria bacterium]|nr:C39 family peptidase [Candidatus Gracilibacteria bacterium]